MKRDKILLGLEYIGIIKEKSYYYNFYKFKLNSTPIKIINLGKILFLYIKKYKKNKMEIVKVMQLMVFITKTWTI